MGSGSTEDLSEKPKVVIHTDGACSGNPGPGGWGVILQSGQHRKELKGGEEHTTNNRMELMAAISALEALKAPSDIDLYTDSNYLRGGITSWIKGWKRNGWRTADKKSVRNIELWQRLEQAAERHHVRWHWVKGHHGHDDNERADELAREGMEPFPRAPQAQDGRGLSSVGRATTNHPHPRRGQRRSRATAAPRAKALPRPASS